MHGFISVWCMPTLPSHLLLVPPSLTLLSFIHCVSVPVRHTPLSTELLNRRSFFTLSLLTDSGADWELIKVDKGSSLLYWRALHSLVYFTFFIRLLKSISRCPDQWDKLKSFPINIVDAIMVDTRKSVSSIAQMCRKCNQLTLKWRTPINRQQTEDLFHIVIDHNGLPKISFLNGTCYNTQMVKNII